MKENPSRPPPEPPPAFTLDPKATCSECGAFGAFNFDGIWLCPSCYAEKGSCCPEFGKDDLWDRRPSS